MDQLTRQIQKNNMWVRRRNSTADRGLQSRLRNLESGYYRGYRQYLRDKMRTESELRDMEERPTETTGNAIANSDSGKARTVLQQSTGRRTHRHQDEFSDGWSRSRSAKTTATCEDDVGPGLPQRRAVSAMSHLSSSAGGPLVSVSSSLTELSVTSSTPRAHRARVTASAASATTAASRSTGTSCKYDNSQAPTHRCCSHFPCRTPHTYHTIGFRRNDLIPWYTGGTQDGTDHADYNYTAISGLSEEAAYYEEKLTGDIRCDTPEAGLTSSLPSQLSIQSDSGLLGNSSVRRDGVDNSDTFVTRAARDKKGPFQRSFAGPAFAPIPIDPILEHVRDGGNKPLEMTGRVTARVRVKDKLRGLRCLVNEMRTRNERSRPREWAVNYGERVPMRLLLNPVVPVHLA